MKNKVLLEDSFERLYSNTVQGFPQTDRDAASARIQVTTTAYIPATNSLEVRAKSKGDGPQYDTVTFFDNVSYVDEDDIDGITFMAPDNTEYTIKRIPKTENVRVYCTCLDFYYRFAVWNDKADSLYGNVPAPYVKKTNRAPQNPRKLPGLCKHLLKMFDYLEKEKIIK